ITLVDTLMLSWPSTRPCGSKRVKQNWSTRSSSGTPYWRPMLTAIAKQFIMLRNAAPSLCMSMKISPRPPSSYSPVRRNTLWPAMRASCVNPWRGRGGRGRLGLLLDGRRERLRELAAVAVERHGLEPQLPRGAIDLLDVLDR